MQIESIEIQNYRLFRQTELRDLPRLTIVVGANGSGKTTLFDVSDPGDLVLDPTCVRKGTKILTPLNPPVNGGKAVDCGNVMEETWGSGLSAPSPLTGRVGEGFFKTADQVAILSGMGVLSSNTAGQKSCPVTRISDVASSGAALRPIETIRPGDEVFGHDGAPHRVKRIISRHYVGPMIGISAAHFLAGLWLTADHYVLCARRELNYGGDRSWKHVHAVNFERARGMRKEMTTTERTLWKSLRRNEFGLAFRRQHPIGPYIVDFYCRDAALVVEVDGDSHFTPDGLAYDRERSAYLEALGLTEVRFTNEDVRTNIPSVLETLAQAAATVRSSDDHHKQWRRADSLRIGDVIYTAKTRRLSQSFRQQEEISTKIFEPGLYSTIPVNGKDSDGTFLKPIQITSIEQTTASETVYDLEVEGSHSFVTEVCAVHNCSSGTTAYVAEQWGRRLSQRHRHLQEAHQSGCIGTQDADDFEMFGIIFTYRLITALIS